MAQTTIHVTCDLLRNSDLGLANIDIVTRWWADLIAPLAESAGYRVDAVTTEGQGGAFPSKRFVEACGLPPEPQSWERLFFRTELPAAAESLLAEHFTGQWVLGGLPPMLSSHLSRRGIPFVDLEFDQIRFARDLFLRTRTNDPSLSLSLARHTVPDDFIRREAGLLRARLGWREQPIDFSPARRVGLFIGQTVGDTSMLELNGMRHPAEFVAEARDAFQRCDLVLLLPHPYVGHTRNLDPIRDALKRARYCGLNTYALLCHPQVEVVAGLSSSVLAEAPFFGKRVKQFVRFEHLNLRQFVPDASPNYRLELNGLLRSLSERLTGQPPGAWPPLGYSLREAWNLDYSLNLNTKESFAELEPGGQLNLRHLWPPRHLAPSGFVSGDGDGFWTAGGDGCLSLHLSASSEVALTLFSRANQTAVVRCAEWPGLEAALTAGTPAELRVSLPAGVNDVRICSPSALAVSEIRAV